MAFLAPLALGTAATGTAAATAGLFGTAGAFSLGTTLSTLGTLAGGLGSMQQSKAAQASATYNQRVAAQNAEIAKQQTKEQLEQQDRERRMRLGANLASAGASGTGMGGSAGDILAANAAQEELDLMNIKSEGALRAGSYTSEANLYGMEAKSAKTAGRIGAGTKLLTGASKLF